MQEDKDIRAHWDEVYRAKSPVDTSWYQESPEPSLQLIQKSDTWRTDRIIDIGGGASTLAAYLVNLGCQNLSVLDISQVALDIAAAKLGHLALTVQWIRGDVTSYEFEEAGFDTWHDRAVFHFLVDPGLQQAYVQALTKGLRAGGHVIIATFAIDGPPQCSGLPTARHTIESLGAILGEQFNLIEFTPHAHETPFHEVQRFLYCRFQKRN